MSPVTIIIAAALTFGICFLVDKGYTRLFRSKQQHKSGLQVRLSKRYASIGLVLCILGILAVFTGVGGETVLLIGGGIVIFIGCALIGHYMSFGVYYDADSFIVTTFGKKNPVYRFRDIRHQKLYMIQGGSIVVELHMADGSAVSIHTSMEGAYPFLDHAFNAWCRQTDQDPEDCTFHDPGNHLWFPNEEEA